MMTPREHARLLGVLLWVYVAIQTLLVGFLAIFYVGIFGTMMSSMPHRANEPNPEAFFGIIVGVMVFVFVLTLLYMIPKVVAGYGLRHDKSWAKIWTIIACCLAVLSVPFGTAVAVYGFWFIFGDEGKAYFDGRGGANDFSPAQPPAPNQWQ